MYFLLLMLKSGRKISALQPQTIYSEVPYISLLISGLSRSLPRLRPKIRQGARINRAPSGIILGSSD